MKLQLKLNDKIQVSIMGQLSTGKVTGVGEHNGRPCVDFVDENGYGRFCYPSQIQIVNDVDIDELLKNQN